MSRVAVLGLGTMGLPIAHRLLALGHEVHAWSRSSRPELPAGGAYRFETARDAVRDADAVLVVVADDAALTDVLVGEPGGIGPALRPDQLVVSLSTVSPDTVRRLAAELAARGVPLVDAGMLGNAAHARDGHLRFYIGGDDEPAEAALALLQQVGKEAVRVGPLGSGISLKLVLNLVMGLEMQALAEAAALGASLGLDRATVLDTIAGSGFGAPVMSFKSRRMVARRYSDPDFRLALMAKDIGLAEQVAAAAGQAVPMTSAARATHAAACASGLGEQDCAAIAEALGAPARRGSPS
jgi:3-hydroxyisobutyrate dehydrogenase